MLLANKAANDENKSVDARRQFIYLERDSLTDCWRQSITDIRNRATRTANDCWKSSNSISTINVAKKPGLRLFRNQVDRDWAVRSECKSQQLSSPTETTSRDAETRNIETRHWAAGTLGELVCRLPSAAIGSGLSLPSNIAWEATISRLTHRHLFLTCSSCSRKKAVAIDVWLAAQPV